MVLHSSEALRDDDEANTDGPIITAREVVSIGKTQEELGVARCPLCRAALVARQGRSGPYFFCRCLEKPAKRAS